MSAEMAGGFRVEWLDAVLARASFQVMLVLVLLVLVLAVLVLAVLFVLAVLALAVLFVWGSAR